MKGGERAEKRAKVGEKRGKEGQDGGKGRKESQGGGEREEKKAKVGKKRAKVISIYIDRGKKISLGFRVTCIPKEG